MRPKRAGKRLSFGEGFQRLTCVPWRADAGGLESINAGLSTFVAKTKRVNRVCSEFGGVKGGVVKKGRGKARKIPAPATRCAPGVADHQRMTMAGVRGNIYQWESGLYSASNTPGGQAASDMCGFKHAVFMAGRGIEAIAPSTAEATRRAMYARIAAMYDLAEPSAIAAAVGRHTLDARGVVVNIGVSERYRSPVHGDRKDVGFAFAFPFKCGHHN